MVIDATEGGESNIATTICKVSYDISDIDQNVSIHIYRSNWREPVKTATLQNGHNQNGHTEWDHYQNGHTTLVKTATLLWSKRPHRMGSYQNGHAFFGQNGHGHTLLVKTATLFWSKRPQGGLYLNEQKWLPKRPHCIWSKRPQIVSDINFVKSEYLNAFAWHPKTSTTSLC